MGDNDIIGTVTGTATFERVRIEPGQNLIKVYGQYNGDPHATIYEFERGRLRIGGLAITPGEDPIYVDPEDDDGWVWVEATEGTLDITKGEPGGEQ